MDTTRWARWARRAPLLALLLSTLGVATCDVSGPGLSELHELSTNRARWSRVGPDAYSYAVRRLCFCAGPALVAVRVTVLEDGTVERVYVETGEEVPEELQELFPTVDGLFDVLADAFDRNAHSVEVTYDPSSGAPLDIFIDYRENVADEELGFDVVESVTAR